MERHTFNKKEKLKSRKSIEILFRTGNSISSPPLRLIYRKINDGSAPIMMTVSVPKKLIKKAVHRNLLKRRIREVYRQLKPAITKQTEEKSFHYEIMFVYQASEVVEYRTIKNAVNVLLIRLSEIISR
ncbi:MAG: ribonuclease P protein component [Bacteroidales bacterium]